MGKKKGKKRLTNFLFEEPVFDSSLLFQALDNKKKIPKEIPLPLGSFIHLKLREADYIIGESNSRHSYLMEFILNSLKIPCEFAFLHTKEVPVPQAEDCKIVQMGFYDICYGGVLRVYQTPIVDYRGCNNSPNIRELQEHLGKLKIYTPGREIREGMKRIDENVLKSALSRTTIIKSVEEVDY